MNTEHLGLPRYRGKMGANISMGLTPSLKLYPLKITALILLVSPATIRRWCKAKLIVPRHALVSGRAYKLVFTEKEILRFIEENMPTADDLEFSNLRSERAARIKRIISMHRAYAGKASAAAAAKRCERLR